ncbi:MAG TPA: TIGR01777 family oxidoreductase [Alphaproteobacteria bacterium]|nr:TIGR01777 family oxidoreductase [Alphaproteobacteria bacterium]
MRVGILGGSGFIGRHLRAALLERGDEVVLASLRTPQAAAQSLGTCDAIVNLAGEPIAQRWTDAVKERLRSSRVEGTRALLDALAREERRPPAYVSASAVGYYASSETETYTEASPAGHDFLAELCRQWEHEAQRAAELGMRVAIVRTGVVLGSDGGALAAMLPIFRLGLGGVLGSGKQWTSWIHIDDIVGIYRMALDGASGTFNGTAPHPVTNIEFTQQLGAALRRPAVFAVPGFALRMALGEASEVLLTGARVLPQHTLESGYMFRFTAVEDALRDLLQ